MKLKKKLAQPFCRELGVPPASSRPGATHSCRLQGAWQAPFPFPCLTHWHPAFLHTFFLSPHFPFFLNFLHSDSFNVSSPHVAPELEMHAYVPEGKCKITCVRT